MPVASLENIEKTFGQRVLFEGLNLAVERGERIGLVGDNGAGKSTLFKMLVGQLPPDAGTISVARSIKIGYLRQDPVFDPANTVMDEAELAFADLHRLSHRLRELEHDMAHVPAEALEKVLRQYQTTQHEFDLAGGYAWRHRLEATLQGVGLEPAVWEQNVQTLSGGQRSRLALARELIAEPDLLLLDEPTNHLDLAAIDWLEKYLLDYAGAVLLISHDRYLLDRLATRIAWLTQAQINSYPGNYSAFISQRQIQELSQQRAYEQQQADIAKQQEFIRRFGAGQRSKEAKGREKRLNRLLQSDAMIAQVRQSRHIHLSLDTDQRAGDQVLRVTGLCKSYPARPLWTDLSLHIKRGQRVGLIGPNGSGKTTLLEVLLGLRDADAGDIRWGANLNIGYYDQKLDDFDPEETVLQTIARERNLPEKRLRDVLGRMLFHGDDVHKAIRLLSGGERARVRLAELLLDEPNVLLLDEPTNHLDIASREALESTLGDFGGTILAVSHDRYFLDRSVNRLWILQPPGMVDFEGNYSKWREYCDRRAAQARPSKSQRKPPAANRTKPAKSRKSPASPSAAQLEQQIGQTESAIAQCQKTFADPTVYNDPDASRQTQDELDRLKAQLRELEEAYFSIENG